jgi:hypothetical protein
MTIDTHPTDTFTASYSSGLYQHRGDKCRFINVENAAGWNGTQSHSRRVVPRDVALAWIRDGLGHTITEGQPQPTPVPWPTHAVVSKINGLVNFRGTHDQCLQFIGGLPVEHNIHPLAPAPLTPAMRRFLHAFASESGSASIRIAAQEALNEGGAA